MTLSPETIAVSASKNGWTYFLNMLCLLQKMVVQSRRMKSPLQLLMQTYLIGREILCFLSTLSGLVSTTRDEKC